ncbi:MAG: hypothetical protein Tp152SUR00d2C52646391_68 [Prokaryotic dsDNA virus sp.]|nr:MAG: hypothetical protein Tp152SUR00d2C52646391_68 [Prokaryotic dsDNA virus sp.]|tara:strand:+ start:4537 stop:4866 length:330 start_codon:yes stop_codon:yes gene_type:complete
MNGSLKVGRVRASHPRTSKVIRVDRTSVLGNPYKMYGEHMRDEVCDNYAVWLKERIKAKDEVILGALEHIADLVYNGHDVIITCHCTPKRCHADEIKRVVERALVKLKI